MGSRYCKESEKMAKFVAHRGRVFRVARGKIERDQGQTEARDVLKRRLQQHLLMPAAQAPWSSKGDRTSLMCSIRSAGLKLQMIFRVSIGNAEAAMGYSTSFCPTSNSSQVPAYLRRLLRAHDKRCTQRDYELVIFIHHQEFYMLDCCEKLRSTT